MAYSLNLTPRSVDLRAAGVVAVAACSTVLAVVGAYAGKPFMPLLVLLGCVVGYFAVVAPIWAFYAMVMLLPVRGLSMLVRSPIMGFYFAPYRILLLLLFISILLRAAKGWHLRVLKAPMTYPLLLLVCLGGASLLQVGPSGSVDMWAKRFLQSLVCLSIYVVTIILINNRRRFELGYKVLALTGVVHGVIGIIDYLMFLLGGPSFTRPPSLLSVWMDPPRAQGLMDDPNFFMLIVISMTLLIPAWSLRSDNRLVRNLWLVGALTVLFLMPMTMSQGGMISLAMVAVTMLILSTRLRAWSVNLDLVRIWRRMAIVVASLGLVLMTLVFTYSPLHAIRLTRSLTSPSSSEGLAKVGTGRLGLWMGVLSNFPRHPLGVGLGNSPKVAGGNFAHNTLLEILAEMGLPGVLVYLWLMFETLKMVVRHVFSKRYSIWLTSIGLALIAIYFSGLTLSIYLDEILAILWGFLVVGNELAERDRTETQGALITPGSTPVVSDWQGRAERVSS